MWRFRLSRVVVCVVAVSGMLFGCKASPTPSSTLSPVVSPLTSPLVTESGEAPVQVVEPFVVPMPGADMSVVTGQIVDQLTGKAPLEGVVYLGKLTSMDTGAPIVSLHKNEDPRAIPNPDGFFAITDVPPGEYGVILLTPDISFLLDKDNGDSLLIEIKAGETLDVGKLWVTMPGGTD